MIKIRKTFTAHLRELVAVILLQIAAKIAPKHIKSLCRITVLRTVNMSRTENIYLKESNNERKTDCI